jgi:hypothetical protein
MSEARFSRIVDHSEIASVTIKHFVELSGKVGLSDHRTQSRNTNISAVSLSVTTILKRIAVPRAQLTILPRSRCGYVALNRLLNARKGLGVYRPIPACDLYQSFALARHGLNTRARLMDIVRMSCLITSNDQLEARAFSRESLSKRLLGWSFTCNRPNRRERQPIASLPQPPSDLIERWSKSRLGRHSLFRWQSRNTRADSACLTPQGRRR